MKKCSGFP